MLQEIAVLYFKFQLFKVYKRSDKLTSAGFIAVTSTISSMRGSYAHCLKEIPLSTIPLPDSKN
jgi:hypothetical protein